MAEPARTTPAKRAPRADEIQRWLVTRIAGTLRMPEHEVDTATPFFDFGLDSNAVVELAAALGDWLERDLDATLAWNFPTIDALAQQLAQPVSEADARPAAQAAAPAPQSSASARLLHDLLDDLYD